MGRDPGQVAQGVPRGGGPCGGHGGATCGARGWRTSTATLAWETVVQNHGQPCDCENPRGGRERGTTGSLSPSPTRGPARAEETPRRNQGGARAPAGEAGRRGRGRDLGLPGPGAEPDNGHQGKVKTVKCGGHTRAGLSGRFHANCKVQWAHQGEALRALPCKLQCAVPALVWAGRGCMASVRRGSSPGRQSCFSLGIRGRAGRGCPLPQLPHHP